MRVEPNSLGSCPYDLIYLLMHRVVYILVLNSQTYHETNGVCGRSKYSKRVAKLLNTRQITVD